MVENLAGMLKVLGLTSSTRGKKIRKKKGKKNLCSVLPFLGGQPAQRSCVEDRAWGRGDSGRKFIFSPRTLGMQRGKPGL